MIKTTRFVWWVWSAFSTVKTESCWLLFRVVLIVDCRVLKLVKITCFCWVKITRTSAHNQAPSAQANHYGNSWYLSPEIDANAGLAGFLGFLTYGLLVQQTVARLLMCLVLLWTECALVNELIVGVGFLFCLIRLCRFRCTCPWKCANCFKYDVVMCLLKF